MKKQIPFFSQILFLTTFLLSAAGLFGSMNAQQRTLHAESSSQMEILGDSNLKKWSADVTEVQMDLVVSDELTDWMALSPKDFVSLALTIPVKGIDSDSRGLTKNIHKYLNKKSYPEIRYTLENVTSVEIAEDGSGSIEAAGTVFVSGVSLDVMMSVGLQITEGELVFSGAQELLMTDFGIEPPTALMGTIRADDTIVVTHDVRVKRPALVNTASL